MMSKRYFEYRDEKSSKFWEVEVKDKNIVISFGRIGTKGQKKTKTMASHGEAKREAEKLITQKIKKGYVEMSSPSKEISQPEDSPWLENKLAGLQKNVLGGRKPTEELRAFWDCWLKNKEKAFFYDDEYCPFSLVSEEPEIVHDYLSLSDSVVWEAMFKEISWIGEENHGGLIGYFHQGADNLDSAPVIYLSNEGCFDLAGTTIVDYFAWAKGYEELELLFEFCDNYGLRKPLDSKARDDSIKDLKSPEVRFEEIIKEINNQKAKAPKVRPVDNYPVTLKLNNGHIIVISSEDYENVSGYDANASFIFDPSSGSFSLIPKTPFKMYLNTKGVGCLKDGRAVFVKFTNGSRVAVFNPASGEWKAGTALEEHSKVEGTAPAIFQDGRVIIAGGYKYRNIYFDTIYSYDIDKDKWSESGKLAKARTMPSALSLPDGHVLFLGGEYLKEGESFPSEAEECDLFDPADGRCRTISPMPEPIRYPHALLLADGKVLVTGNDNQYAFYDPQNDKWSSVIKNNQITMSFVQLNNEKIAFFNNDHTVTLLDRKTSDFSDGGSTLLPRGASVPVLLNDGRVLLVGGNLFHNIACEPEIWNPATGKGQPITGFEEIMEKQVKDLQKYRDKKK
jgi:predicted DNA-binding WGR domain protein